MKPAGTATDWGQEKPTIAYGWHVKDLQESYKSGSEIKELDVWH